MKKVFETLKHQFIEKLNQQIFIYTTIGSHTNESPMWLQLNYTIFNNKIKVSNSQTSKIYFFIDIDESIKETIKDDISQLYDYLKYIKYIHIKEIAPTVFEELNKGSNGIRINDFLNSYNK